MHKNFMNKYQNREEAGRILAQELVPFAKQNDVIVLALPRGGVPVAFEIAKALHAPLDVFIVRKLGVPGHSELAMGAIAMGGVSVLNDDIVKSLNITHEEIEAITQKELQELERRKHSYRSDEPFPSLQDKIIILVDDGIATGATMRVAIKALRKLKADKIIVAVPVAAEDTCEDIQKLADGLICPLRPQQFYAVGAWYNDFAQTEDDEVFRLLKDARKLESTDNHR